MSPLRILVVDDEPLARLRLRGLVEAIQEPRCEVVAEAATGSQAASWLREHGCDVVLLDVQMPGIDGLQFADVLSQRQPGLPVPLIIFVTAHAMHAVRAFELEALDYLTKPVRRERLQAALARAAQRLVERAAVQVQQPADAPAAAEQADFITLTDRGRLLRVPLGDVLYFKAELKYVTVRTVSRSYILDGSLSELEERHAGRFMRIHRNALIARRAVRTLEKHFDAEEGEGWAVRLNGIDELLAVSRRQLSAVREAIAG